MRSRKNNARTASRTLEDNPWQFTGRNGCTDKGGWILGKFDTEAMLNMLEKKVWNRQGLITAALKSGIWQKCRKQQKYRPCARAGCFGA